MNKAFNLLKNELCILILDYNRPENLANLLNSIKHHIKFKCEITVLSNGGDTDYAYSFFKSGAIDKLISSRENEGSSLGTLRLIQSCSTKYFLYLQADSFFIKDFDLFVLNQMKQVLENTHYKAIDFTTLVPFNCKFSERAFLMERDLYLKCDYNSGYGTGPFYNPSELNSEQGLCKFFEENRYEVYPWGIPFICDSGKYAIIELPCGGILKRRTDSHQVWVVKTPKNKINLFNLNDDEWNLILSNRWVNGSIPQHGIKHGFLHYSKELDPIEN